MPSLPSAATAVSLLLFYASTANAQACSVALKTPTDIGCFSSSDPLVDQGSYTFQTGGYCQCQCATIGKAVFATTKGSDCYCGDLIPTQSSASSNSSCNSPCNGFGQDTCGGNGFWQVALTGVESSVGQEGGSASTPGSSNTTPTPSAGSTATSTHSPSVVTVGGQTIVVTASSSATGSAQKSSGGGGSKTAVAVGVVVGVLLVAAIVGGVIFFLKQRKKRAVEEEFKRAAEVNAFVAGKKSEASSTNDQRLDPSIMQHRRQSIGSIADERDFSRRILQVRNPDDV